MPASYFNHGLGLQMRFLRYFRTQTPRQYDSLQEYSSTGLFKPGPDNGFKKIQRIFYIFPFFTLSTDSLLDQYRLFI